MIGDVCFMGDKLEDHIVDTYTIRFLDDPRNVGSTDKSTMAKHYNYESFCVCTEGDIVLLTNNHKVLQFAEVMPSNPKLPLSTGNIYGMLDLSAFLSTVRRIERRQRLMNFMLQANSERKALSELKQIANGSPELADAFDEWNSLGMPGHRAEV